MFQEINDENEQKQFANKITPQMLGLKPTNDYAQFVNQTICDEAPEKAKIWKEKGPIGVMEAGNMYARELVGDYNNVYTNQAQRNDYLNKHPLIKKWNDSAENREQNQAKRIAERNKRVNEGTGSLIDRTGAFLDRIGTNTTKAQIQQADILEQRAMPHKNDPNYKYLPKNVIPGYVSYDEIDLRKKIGFVEGLADSVSSGKATPFFGGAIEGWKNGHIEKIRDKIDNGEQITQRELDEFNRYKDYLYEKQIRGYSIGGEIGESWLPSLVAFGSEMALGGAALKLVGLAGKGLAVGNAVEKGLNKINKFGKVGDAIAKGTGFATGQLAEGGISAGVGTLVNSPSRLWATFSERRLNDKMKITDRGTVIFTQAYETPARAFIKSLESVYLSYFTENMGGLIGAGLIKPISKLAQKTVVNPVTKKAVSVGAEQFKRVLEHCPKLEKFIQKTTPLFARAYEKLNNLPMRSESIDWLKSQVKFDGFLEEMGEEVLEDVLNLAIGTNDEERSLENYVKAIFKTPEEWAVIAGVIGLQGGTISLAGNLLADAMQRSGVPENKIAEVIQNSTENEKHDLISGLLDDGTIQTSDLTDEERARQREIKDDIYQKLTNIGIKNEEANNISILTGSMFEKYGTKNDESRKVFDDYINNLVVKYNIPADEKVGQFQSANTAGTNNSAEISAAKKEWEEKGTDSKYFKKWFGDSKVVDESGEPLVVYHGSRNNFEVFEHKEGLDSDINSINTKEAFFFVNDDIAADEFAEVQREAQIIRLQAEKHVGSGYNNLNEKQRLDEEIKKQSYNDNIRYNVYLSIQNPIIADFKGEEYNTEKVDALILQAKENGNDGVIIKNINDVGGTHTQYAVFNPEQIKSVNNKGTFDKSNSNIYFQSANNNIVDLTNEFEKAPTIDEVKNYINEIVENGTKFATLSPNWFVDIKGGRRTTNKILNAGNYKKLEKMGRKRHNKYIMSLEKLLANAEYAGEKENTKKDKKPNIEKYHYFKTDVKIGNKTYQLIFDTEEYKNSPQTAQHDNRVLNPQSEDTSIINDNANKFKGDTEEYKNDNKKSTSVRYAERNLNKTEVDTNSINDNAENINPKTVHLYNIKEIKTPKTYFQIAYKGSPSNHKVESTDYIGTGEGYQAHGWGLYYSEDKKVGEGYRKRLTHDDFDNPVVPVETIYDGKEIFDADLALALENVANKGKEYAISKLDEEIQTVKSNMQTLAKMGEDKSEVEGRQAQIQDLEGYKNFIRSMNLSKLKVEERKRAGQLYKVDIPENDVLLDEDKPLNEQPEKVRKIIFDYVKDNKEDFILPKDYNSLPQMRGHHFYRNVALIERKKGAIGNGNKEASLSLKNYGIKGITYDGYQDGRCYVIFDDKAIKILKTYYQESENENEKLIAGFTYPEVMEKLTALYEQLTDNLNSKEKDSLMAKIHILEDAFDISEHPDKFRNEEVRTEKMLNAYYVLNNQEIPKDYIEADALSKRSYKDLKNIHDKKKEEAESKYYGYFSKTEDKSIITIMANHNGSTALHEFGHLFLDMLVELAKVNEDARIQLDAVNKWLGYAGEYTTAQHEKFANNFVAYLYKGKAPNNKLRTVFENFKEWLKSVYNHILDIPNVDISDEVQELFDNIFGDDNYYEERKQATQLLKKIKNTSRRNKLENIPERKDKSLTDTQKRCKQASYEILSVATGKDINYLKRIFETSSNKNGYAKRREIVEELLENADDRITASGGMRENWKEFYGDTGVSYNNDEINGDFELAEKALDTIINKDYFDPAEKIDNQLQNEAEYYEKAIDNANREYKVLLRSFKNENRNVVLATAYEWLDKLPEKIKQDYEDKFIFDTRMIERDENANKFDKAKRRILAKAMELQSDHSLNANEAYKELVLETVKNLSFLQPLDKAKLTTNILDVPSASFLMSSIDNILDIAKTMEDVNLRRELERRIHKEIQQTKNIKKNGRTVGKYDYKSNKLFEELRQLDRLTPEQANEQRLENKRFAEKEDSGMSSKERLINEFLSYKAGGRTFANTELMKKLYDEILKIKLAGKTAKSELDLIEKISEEKDIEELISIVQNKKNGNDFQELLKKGYISGVANLESTLNAIFNKDIAQRYGAEILYAETQSQAWQHEQKQSFEKQVAKIYNLPQWHWDKIILEHLSKKHKFTEFRRKYNEKGEVIKVRQIERELTEMDIIQAFIWSKNEILEKRLKNQFGEDTLETMFNLLSKEDEQLAKVMMQTAQSFYPLVNKAFINKYGLDLPKVSCYFPSTPERGSEIDLYNEYSSKSLGNSFTKSRGQSETLPMDFHNPVTTLYSHIDGVAKFAFMSEYLDKANLRFKDSDLKRTIINKYGEDAYRTLEQLLMNVTYKNDSKVFSGMNKIMDNLIGNWIQANVSIKPIVGLKQLLSANNYAVDMPYLTWQKGFLDGLKNPNKTIDYMMNIPYLKARYEGSLTNEFLKQTINNSKYATTKKLKDLFGTFIKMGDIGAIIFGGKPYIDYLMKEKGMSEKEAIKQFVLSTNRSQQSSAVSSLSNFQISMTRNPLGKLFIAYKNSPLQYVRMCADAIISVQNGDMSKKDCAKILFQYAYLQPFLYAIATSGSIFHWVLTGDDDDILKDIRMSIFDLNSSAFPLLGDIYKYFLDKVIYKGKTMIQTTPLIGDIEREIAKIAKDDVTVSDYLGFLAYISLQAGMGINTKAIGSMTSGVGDIATGNVAQGSLKVFGYTDKRAKHIVDDEN